MKRSPMPPRKQPMNRGSAQLKRTPLARESSKRRGERDARRDAIETAVGRDGARCAIADAVPEIVCWGPLDPHEFEFRSARPGGHLDGDNVRMICRAHHDWVHAEPIEAARRGLRTQLRGGLDAALDALDTEHPPASPD